MQHPRIFGRGHIGRGRTNIAPTAAVSTHAILPASIHPVPNLELNRVGWRAITQHLCRLACSPALHIHPTHLWKLLHHRLVGDTVRKCLLQSCPLHRQRWCRSPHPLHREASGFSIHLHHPCHYLSIPLVATSDRQYGTYFQLPPYEFH